MRKILSLMVLSTLLLTLFACEGLFASEETYSVTFNTNGGTPVDVMTVKANQSFIPLQVTTKEGYIFSGWYLDANLMYPMAFNAGVDANTILYAKWDQIALSESEIRAIIDAILGDQELMIADQQAITNLVTTLISSGEVIDEASIIAAILTNIDVVALFEAHVSTMLEQAKQSVVMIETYQGSQVDGGGSGVIYKKVGNTYYVLTNEHVVSGYLSNQISLTIFTPQGEVKINRNQVTLKGVSVLHDMAVLTFTSTQNFRVIEMGSKASLKVGQMVYAIGSPLDLPNSVSMGIISKIDRPMSDDYGMDTIMIQHTAPINPGNSGGALVDIYGKLIGLNDMSYVDEYIGEGIEGLHFAIQIDILLSIIPTLEN
jgi:uncharacterized repeat protein (TIGR02543 family)